MRIADVTFGKSIAAGPGQLAGRPTVAFAVELTNRSRRSIDVNTVQVSVTYGAQQTPAIPSRDQGANTAFRGSIKPAASARAVYKFQIPADEQRRVDVAIWYKPGAPTALFRGSLR